MEVNIKAYISFNNIDKPEKPFRNEEWKETLKLLTGADEVDILDVGYWDVTPDDETIEWY